MTSQDLLKKLIEVLRKEQDDKLEKLNSRQTNLPQKTYSWIQRHITKRREYKEYTNKINEEQGNIQDERIKIISKKNKIQYVEGRYSYEKNPMNSLDFRFEDVARGLGITMKDVATKLLDNGIELSLNDLCIKLKLPFKEAIEMLEKRNIPLIVDEINFKYGQNVFEVKEDYKSLSDFVLVHKTNYQPRGRIRTSKETGRTLNYTITINGEELNISSERERNTTHFSLNGEVGEHAYGTWYNTEYAIIMPFSDVYEQGTMRSANVVDTYTVGGVDITQGSFIICPAGKREEVVKNNPGIHIIEYRGGKEPNVSGFANTVVSMMGISPKQHDGGGGHWRDQDSQRKAETIIKGKTRNKDDDG